MCRLRPGATTWLQSSKGSTPLSCVAVTRGALLSSCSSSDDGLSSHNKACSSDAPSIATDASCRTTDCPESKHPLFHEAGHAAKAAYGSMSRADLTAQQQALLLPPRLAPARPVPNGDAPVTWASRLKAANCGAQPTGRVPQPSQCQASLPKPSPPLPIPAVSISAQGGSQCSGSAGTTVESGIVTPVQRETESLPFARAAFPRSPSSTLSAESHSFAAPAAAPQSHNTDGAQGHSPTASAHCVSCCALRGEAAAAVVGAAAVHHRAALLEAQVISVLCSMRAVRCQMRFSASKACLIAQESRAS